MATNTTSEKLHPLRIIALMLALAGTMTILVAIPTMANAAPANSPIEWVHTNDRYNSTFVTPVGIRLPNGLCSVAMGGVDLNTNEEVLVTVGHCGDVGTVITKNETIVIGEVDYSQMTFSQAGDMNQVDVGVIRLYPNARVAPTGRHIAAPAPGEDVFRLGNDLAFKTMFRGEVSNITPTDFDISTFALPGASGGPVQRGNALVGLTSRAHYAFHIPVMTAMRADAAVNIVRAAGINFQLK